MKTTEQLKKEFEQNVESINKDRHELMDNYHNTGVFDMAECERLDNMEAATKRLFWTIAKRVNLECIDAIRWRLRRAFLEDYDYYYRETVKYL